MKLGRALAALRHGIGVAATEPTVGPVAKAILAAPVVEKDKKVAPVKNFGALDRLFQR